MRTVGGSGGDARASGRDRCAAPLGPAAILRRPREGGPGLMQRAKPVPSIYQRLGVRPIVHAAGTTTRYGGSLLRPEALEAMREASTALVNLDELNEAAGVAIARMLGAEAAF